LTVNSGPDIDAANNDFRRIQNAINAAGNGDTIILNGTFDFTQPFAATAWALGNDNTAGTADDYSVYVPANLNGVTLTATSLGTATIQGPGDLAAVNLEGFSFSTAARIRAGRSRISASSTSISPSHFSLAPEA
jgi:hypothetical protein